MFGINNLRKRIAALEKRLCDIENPYKFNVGDRVTINPRFRGEPIYNKPVDVLVVKQDAKYWDDETRTNYYDVFLDMAIISVREDEIEPI